MTRSIQSHDPTHWRARADEARLQASQATDPKVKAVLLEIALAYERVAEIGARSPGDNK